MTNGRQAGAYPSLIPGNQEGARDKNKPWDVVELEGALKAGVEEAPSTSKQGRVLKVPKVVLRADWWIRYHEMTHVERPTWEQSKNGLRNTMRAMLEEVALDGQCLHRDLIDLRQARDNFDWSKYSRPQDVYRAAAMYFQLWSSAQISKDAELVKLYIFCQKTLEAAELDEPKLLGLSETCAEAAQAVFDDYSSGNCEDWADIVTAKLLGVPKEEIPDAPDPTGTTSGVPSGGATGSGPGSSGVGAEEPGEDPGGESSSGGAGATGDDEDEVGESDGETCDACEGEGVDGDGNECPDCGGTGTTPGGDGAGPELDGEGSPDGDPTGNGAGDRGAEAGDQQGESFSEWDTPPVPLDKHRQNDPMEFGFDPLGKTHVDPHDHPPEKAQEQRERTKVTQEQLQDAIDHERVNRKQGEASQAEELTARTPHGAVDVHRHTLNKGTSASVALGWRSSEMGATVRFPSQLFNSGRVFAKRAPGGSIILDGSGSMQWHAQHIMDAQKQMPNLYVAVYSYHGSNGYWNATKGRVATDTFIARYCILAQKGQLDPEGIQHKDSEWQHTGGNSGADPASLWYACRWAPKPIVWVSDGMVDFGEKQGFYQNCDSLMRQHKIGRVLTIEDAIDYLLGKAVPGWHQSATVDTRWVRLGQPHTGRSSPPDHTMSEARRWTQLRANSRKR